MDFNKGRMKNIGLFFIIICCSIFSYSQGNLQFNRVITLTGGVSVYGGGVINSSPQTVPVGKVWKIEHVGGSINQTYNGIGRMGVLVNNNVSIFHSTSPVLDHSITPLWLKEGDNIAFYTCCGGGGTNEWTYIISIIEFNVIP